MESQIEQSPWGKVEAHGMVAPGIVWVRTAGHGGLWLSPARVQQFRIKLPEFRPHAGFPWLEEDCDAAAATLVWPECYQAEAIRNAVRIYLCQHHITNALGVQGFLAVTAEGKALVETALAWERKHAMCWEVGGGCTKYGGWLAWLYRVGDRKHLARWFEHYPTMTIYTDGELENLSRSEDEASKRQRARELKESVFAS